MSHGEILQAYLSHVLKTPRKVEVTSELKAGEIHVTRRTIQVSVAFVNPDTDLPELASRCTQILWDFDTRQERERLARVKEIERSISEQFRILSRLDSERAHQMILTLTEHL